MINPSRYDPELPVIAISENQGSSNDVAGDLRKIAERYQPLAHHISEQGRKVGSSK